MFRCWRLPQHSGLKFAPASTAAVHASAPPAAVWQVLTDVARVGEWSHECHTATWTDAQPMLPSAPGSAAATVPARRGGATVHHLTLQRPVRVSAIATQGRLMRDSTEWYFALEPEDAGTRITQQYRIRSLAAWADRLGWLIIPSHHDRRAALERDLERLAAIAASEARPTGPSPARLKQIKQEALWPHRRPSLKKLEAEQAACRLALADCDPGEDDHAGDRRDHVDAAAPWPPWRPPARPPKAEASAHGRRGGRPLRTGSCALRQGLLGEHRDALFEVETGRFRQVAQRPLPGEDGEPVYQ